MAWTEDTTHQPRAWLATGTTAFEPEWSLLLTSTSTIVVDQGTAEARLRMYGIGRGALLESARAFSTESETDRNAHWGCDPEDAAGGCVGVGGMGNATDFICYLDSGRVDPAAPDCTAPYVAWVPDLIAVADQADRCDTPKWCGTQPLTATCIPLSKRHCQAGDAAWPHEYIVELATDSSGRLTGHAVTEVIEYQPFAVAYGNPSVVPLGGGRGWLMLLSRSRVFESDITAHDAACGKFPDQAYDGAGNQLGDIVAWWSDSPDFSAGSGTVLGPFLMVDSRDALPGIDLRFWLSVPGGAVVQPNGAGEEYLYLYYAIEPNHTASGSGTYGDGISAAEWEEAAYNHVYTGLANRPWRPGIAVKRFVLSKLLGAFGLSSVERVETASTDESTWLRFSAVSGELLGQVCVWVCDVANHGAMPNVQLFELVYNAATRGPVHAPKMVDPCPMRSDVGFNLFFAANQSGDGETVAVGTAHGIWRAVSVYDTEFAGCLYESLDGGMGVVEIEPIFGVDFVVCGAIGAEGRPRDMVAEADRPGALYLDPDVVFDPYDRVWRVYVGVTGGPMEMWVGAESDGATTWEEAWCSSADDAAASQEQAEARILRTLHWLDPDARQDDRQGASTPADPDDAAPANPGGRPMAAFPASRAPRRIPGKRSSAGRDAAEQDHGEARVLAALPWLDPRASCWATHRAVPRGAGEEQASPAVTASDPFGGSVPTQRPPIPPDCGCAGGCDDERQST